MPRAVLNVPNPIGFVESDREDQKIRFVDFPKNTGAQQRGFACLQNDEEALQNDFVNHQNDEEGSKMIL